MGPTVWDWPGATVTRIIDGDTIVGRMTRDIGFHGTVAYDQRLRLNRINAAKGTTVEGTAATNYLTSLLTYSSYHMRTVGPYTYRDEWMVEIELPTGNNVSDLMVAAGHAVHWDGHGPRPGDGTVTP